MLFFTLEIVQLTASEVVKADLKAHDTTHDEQKPHVQICGRVSHTNGQIDDIWCGVSFLVIFKQCAKYYVAPLEMILKNRLLSQNWYLRSHINRKCKRWITHHLIYFSCVGLSDITGDGDTKLVVADLGSGNYNMKLRVYKGTQMVNKPRMTYTYITLTFW